jgi:hypothetical protein
LGLGVSKIPASCSLTSKECAAPPGDKAFDEARSGVATMNAGIAIDVAGVVALLGGLVWYFVQTPSTPDASPPPAQALSSWSIRF